MNEQQFRTWLIAARSIGGEYGSGYQLGIRRLYHGDQFRTEAEHQKWLGLDGHRQELGDGYRDGYSGKPPRGVHGNIGRRNAAKSEDGYDSAISIRVPTSLKSHCVALANQEGMKLSVWIIKTLQESIANRNATRTS